MRSILYNFVHEVSSCSFAPLTQLLLPLDYDQTLPEGFKNLIIYRSSAGSGKTFTLVKEYLKLVLKDSENYKRILAITFTNKATDEMKSRILSELGLLASGKRSRMHEIIEDEFEKEFAASGNPVPNLQRRANAALVKILHNYGRLGISTLDHFFTRVVRSAAKELGLPLKYDIDVDNRRAIDYAVDRLYREVGDDRSIREWLEEFSFSRIEDNKGWNLDDNLKKLGLELFNERFHEGIGREPVPLEHFKRFVQVLYKKRDDYKQRMKNLARQGLQLINDYDLKPFDFYRKGQGTISAFKRILKEDDLGLPITLQRIARGEGEWFAKGAYKIKQIRACAQGGLDAIAVEMYTVFLEHYRDYNTANQLLRNIYSYGILDALNQFLNEYREENNLVLLADNAFLLTEMIEDQDAPFIYEKLGSYYRHIMIDEFQDTSLYQWQNLLPLVRNSLHEDGRVLIVGDEKQSIYRWRGGEMRLLVSGVEKDLIHFKDRLQNEFLADNFRSEQVVVDFNNNFFKKAVQLLSLQENLPVGDTLITDTYVNTTQRAFHTDSVGFVKMAFFHRDDEKDWQERAKAETLTTIAKAQSDGFALGDILILVDKWVLGDEIAELLLNHSIPIVSDHSLKVQNSPTVKFLLSALRWLNDTDNRLAKTNLLFLFLEFKGNGTYGNHTVLRDIHGKGEIFQEEMPDEFLANLGVYLRLPLYELVENLIITFGLSDRSDSFVLKFLEICLEQSSWGRSDINTFLDWWDETVDDHTIIMPENKDAVEIMTIHKAKGLERPVVLMPLANFEIKTQPGSAFWTGTLTEEYQEFKILPLNFLDTLIQTDFEDSYRLELIEGIVESLNKVYVGFTRAISRLYVFTENFNKTKEIKDYTRLNKLIHGVISSGALVPTRKEEGESDVYEWGVETPLDQKGEELPAPTLAYELPAASSSQPDSKIRLRAESSRFFMLFDNTAAAAIRKGIALHRIFENLEGRHRVEAAVKEMISLALLKADQAVEFTDLVVQSLELHPLSVMFDNPTGVIKERAILSDSKKYVPDRVQQVGNQVFLIDYKTGEQRPSHLKQVKTYADLLEKMGYSNIKKYLIYLDQPMVVEVE